MRYEHFSKVPNVTLIVNAQFWIVQGHVGKCLLIPRSSKYLNEAQNDRILTPLQNWLHPLSVQPSGLRIWNLVLCIQAFIILSLSVTLKIHDTMAIESNLILHWVTTAYYKTNEIGCTFLNVLPGWVHSYSLWLIYNLFEKCLSPPDFRTEISNPWRQMIKSACTYKCSMQILIRESDSLEFNVVLLSSDYNFYQC